MLTLEEKITSLENRVKLCEQNDMYEWKAECEQFATWLRILKKAKFEYDEAWRILTHPTPDVRYTDINKAKMILAVFRNSLGLLDEKGDLNELKQN